MIALKAAKQTRVGLGFACWAVMPLLYTAAVLHWLALGQLEGDGGVPPATDAPAALCIKHI